MKMYKIFLYCLILFFFLAVIHSTIDKNILNLIGNENHLWEFVHKYGTGRWHSRKISYQYR